MHEEPAPGLRPLQSLSIPQHPSARRMTRSPVRADGLHRRSTACLVPPFGVAWNRPPRCLESASTTDVSRHEHPPETALPETTRRAAVGNPAGISTSRSAPTLAFPPLSRQTPDHLAVIQPPAVTRLTAHYRLRVIRRSRFAFAGPLPDAALALVRRFRACRRPSPRYQPGQPCRTKPSDTLGTPGSGAIETAPSPSRRGRVDRGTSMRPMFSDSRCLPPQETIARALSRRSRSMARLLLLANWSNPCTCSSRFENPY